MRRAALLALITTPGCFGPADLQLVGVGVEGGPYERDVFVPEGVAAPLQGRIVNQGGTAAQAPRLSFAPLSCMEIDDGFEAELDGAAVGPGAEVVFPLTVTADGCDVQTIVDWFVDSNEGASRGTFNVVLQR